MKKYALENLDDEMFFSKCDEIYDAMRNALECVLNSWVKEKIITENEKQIAMDDWDENDHGLFPTLLGHD